jgi:hypothetical protein
LPAVAVAQSPAPDPEGAQSLVLDVERVVAAHEVDDWFADSEAMRSIEMHLLPSVCRASPQARTAALSALEAKHTALGDAKQLYEKRREMSGDVARALTAERELKALSVTLARQDECPFWVKAEPGFHGLQSDRKRVTLSVESGGDVRLRVAHQHVTAGGGGVGRLLFGYGLDGVFTLLIGPEFGGGALLRPNSNASSFIVNYFPAVPLILRTRQPTWHIDVEMAPVVLFEADNTRLSWGGRVGAAFGLTTLRRRNIVPWAGLAVAYEHYFDGGGRGPINFLHGGLRVGLPWEP